MGKPTGTAGAAWLLSLASGGGILAADRLGRRRQGGVMAGIGFTVSLLIASLAFHGTQLQEAKAKGLSAALCASALTWSVFRVTASLPKRLQIRALLGTAEVITDLAVPEDPAV